MSTVYTTEDLLRILAEEYRACLNGQRLNLAATGAEANPVVAPFLNTEAIQKFSAYRDFRAAVHRYQIEHQVSGIVWRQLSVQDQTLEFPEVAEQLVALPSDVAVLKQAKPKILDFWSQVTVGMDFYLVTNHGKESDRITASEVLPIAQRADWVGLSKHERVDFLQVILQLGANQRPATSYPQGWLELGSDFICAVNPGQNPIF
ncbi:MULTISPECIES: hypothetical protein [Trichocoleus]|uniref:Uncharacterized protein n=1 Tax=Trichocoleus desertorum GB2-A4 TaxID=2933944 RepID=A0ABV0JB49_9CYAN|nr:MULTISPECIES: hypothetical protein [unclassified Trichocoleus]MBD1863258.1 hypothetical protein [Trichocoleus sp. FACHB-46]MBD2094161.1 hypothetical protein [Trichocoleus sp. FACHB-591]